MTIKQDVDRSGDDNSSYSINSYHNGNTYDNGSCTTNIIHGNSSSFCRISFTAIYVENEI